MTASDWPIRPLQAADVLRMAHLDFEFTSTWALALEKEVTGLAVTWRLVPRRLEQPYRSSAFGPTEQEWAELEQNLTNGLREGFVVDQDGQPVALVELGVENWRSVGVVWNLLVHRPCRRQGIGTALLHAAIDWGRKRSLRALMLEAQTNNWTALRFYRRMGFVPGGVDDHFYTNWDREAGEVALFWYYELEAGDER